MTSPEEIKDRIVIVGAHTILGELMIERLEARPDIEKFWVIDLHPLRMKKYSKVRHIRMDIVEPGADAHLAERLQEIQANVIVHCALKNNPSLTWTEAHELEVIGTLNLVSAAKAAKVQKFILCSSTVVYGASPKNPNYLTETAPTDRKPTAHFVRDKVEAEREVQKLFEEAPQMLVSILRFCLIVGPRSKNYFTDLFRRSIVPTLLGYDPLMQFLAEEDAADALEKVIFESHRGIFNIVGRGVIPLSYALREAGKIAVPIAPFIAYPLVQALWNLQLAAVPGKLLDFFRYLWVADGEKAREVLGFTPKLTSKEAFLDFAEAQKRKRKVA